ncbi:hypothetical protein GGI25_001787 [Coemansia spiralis]|uniref:t-SNARE coiled-coil homology domain-containing protein n=2 Tax=Coemansia TaxID=4863 RepID=A0A9W8KZM5_9FUNG|nr:t-SNARE [Coemansia spiralis]KAJ1994007.1 hypothetical protein EDC05_001918 [Coemansia umbellata]KAJ2622773.1 hypothetical protein GGI26_003042 [Coemansia sp. RSA 1358]KAJ2679015.1 hypothetical protein GGI25_001787 [Coemansia spiralis]
MGRDRFTELQDYNGREDTAIEMGTFNSGGQVAGGGGYADYNAAGYPNGQFFHLLDTVKRDMQIIDDNIAQIARLHEQALAATGEASHRQISADRDQLVAQNNALVSRVKNNLDILAQTADDPNISKSQRVAQASRQQAEAKRFSELLQRYRQMEYQYSQRNRERLERQYRIARPDASDAEISEAIESNQAGQVFAQAVMHSNRIGEARRVLRDVEERQEDMRKIEKTMTELTEMFNEVADMVRQQQELIDTIESAVEDTHGNVEHGHKEVKQAIIYRIKARKKIWIFILLLIILIVIIVIIIYFTVIKKK